ncbi:MAG TPA: glycosyltransferase family 4 protein, partial [Kouleothrix sp.]|nr:glycosyltransferase family 4 protein [Kouleothrix sp.]
VQLRLIGDAPPPELQALANDDVIVAGRVPQIEPWIERASLVLAPVRIGGGMRTKVLQAMAMGKSVVSTSLGAQGLQRSVPPPLAIANTAMDMANIIVRLLEDAEQRQRLGQQARAFVQQYHSAEAYAQRMEYIYSELLAMP